MKEKMNKVKTFLLLHLLLLIYSFGAICSKLAGSADFMSIKFFVYYGLVLLILMIYAVLWQQILKRLPLVTAFANKAVTVIWGLLWGMLFFHEEMRWSKVIAAVFIIIGICFVASEQEEKDS